MRYLIFSAVLLIAATAHAAPREVSYGSDKLQRMDVYAAPKANAPILVMVHGGGWRMGDKASGGVPEPKRSYWKDYLFISVNYRLMPDANPLEQAKDVAAALNNIRANAAAWGGDANRMVVMGHSAGAHLVALLGANPAGFGLQPWRGTVALDSAGYDIEAMMDRRHLRLYDKAFGDDKTLWRDASPIAHVTAQATPFLLVCSSNRRVSCPMATEFAARLKRDGVAATVQEEPLSHMEINRTLGEDSGYTRTVDQFVSRLVH